SSDVFFTSRINNCNVYSSAQHGNESSQRSVARLTSVVQFSIRVTFDNNLSIFHFYAPRVNRDPLLKGRDERSFDLASEESSSELSSSASSFSEDLVSFASCFSEERGAKRELLGASSSEDSSSAGAAAFSSLASSFAGRLNLLFFFSSLAS